MFSIKRTQVIDANLYPAFSGNISAMEKFFSFDRSPENILLSQFAVLCAIAQLTFTKKAVPGGVTVTCDVNGTVTDFDILDTAGMIAANVDEDEVSMWAAFPTLVTPARELLICHSVKRLSTENISNYFLSQGKTIRNASSYLKVLNTYVPSVPKFEDACNTLNLEIDDARRIKFLVYHTAYASAGKLILTAHDNYRPLSDRVFSNEDLVKARASSESPWDPALVDSISINAKAMAYLMFKASKNELKDWYQGYTAFEGMPAALRIRYLSVFQKYLEIKGDTDKVAAVGTMDELLALI